MQIMTVDEVAAKMKKSRAWCYEHAHELGGSLMAGSWVFTLEGLEDAYERGQEVARRRNTAREKSFPADIRAESRRKNVGRGDKEVALALAKHGIVLGRSGSGIS